MNLRDVPFRPVAFPSAEMDVETRRDGTLIVRPTAELEPYEPNLPLVLSRQAAKRPDQPYLLQRDATGEWESISYGETFRRAAAVAGWLGAQNTQPHRSVLILSGNSINHAVFKYGAMAAQIPVCPVSVNYALLGGDFGRLNHVVQLLEPAVVFAEQTNLYTPALEGVDFGDATIVTLNPDELERNAVSWDQVLRTPVPDDFQKTIEAVDPDAPSVYMLTSGSTSLPKAVIHTQRMITSNIGQASQVLGETAGWKDVMLDWLPWNHVSGGVYKDGRDGQRRHALYRRWAADSGPIRNDD